jgi:hypothetical protein
MYLGIRFPICKNPYFRIRRTGGHTTYLRNGSGYTHSKIPLIRSKMVHDLDVIKKDFNSSCTGSEDRLVPVANV